MKRAMKLAEIEGAIAEARAKAIREAKECYPCYKSRGTFLCTAAASGDQCRPAPEAEALQWNGSLKEIDQLLAQVAEMPEVAEVYIAGSYDGANDVRSLCEQSDYDPMVSSWKVTITTRGAA